MLAELGVKIASSTYYEHRNRTPTTTQKQKQDEEIARNVGE
ncbi:hypothetical protein [Nocardia vermiculata]|nr:hypothetical protein [Nocardia vermiculata]